MEPEQKNTVGTTPLGEDFLCPSGRKFIKSATLNGPNLNHYECYCYDTYLIHSLHEDTEVILEGEE